MVQGSPRIAWRAPAVPSLEISFDAGGKRYAAFDGVPFQPRSDGATWHSPVTVLRAEAGASITASWLKKHLDEMSDCNVYRQDLFSSSILITNTETEQAVTTDFYDYLETLGTSWFEMNSDHVLATRLVPGPYLYHAGLLMPVSRLFDDSQRTLLTALKPKMTEFALAPYERLKLGGDLYDCLAVAVPPRPFMKDSRPLHGVRVVVKDMYNVKGLKNSLSNSAYLDWSGVSTSTAWVVQSLVNDGAQILGMAKLSSMIAREEPMEAVDFLTSFNPRGDGYQSPAGSSSGSAAAVASYDWLDCAIGSDTTGSGRRPALANGVWQFRPSHDVVDLVGMIPSFIRFDTPCIFTRKLEIIEPVLRSWLGKRELAPPIDLPYEIIYPLDYLPVQNAEQMKLIDGLVKDMSVHLSAKVTKLSIRDEWKRTHPTETPDDVDEYLKDVVTKTFYYADYHSTEDFRNDYPRSHGGRIPYMIPYIRRRHARGSSVSKEAFDDAMERIEVYKDWLLEGFFHGRGTQVLVVLPISEVKPNYRDLATPSPEIQSALDNIFFSPILKSPDIMVPIGEIAYHSRISEKEEHLPVLVNVVGAPKTDFALLEAVRTVLKGSGRPMNVSTGPRMFTNPDAKKG